MYDFSEPKPESDDLIVNLIVGPLSAQKCTVSVPSIEWTKDVLVLQCKDLFKTVREWFSYKKFSLLLYPDGDIIGVPINENTHLEVEHNIVRVIFFQDQPHITYVASYGQTYAITASSAEYLAKRIEAVRNFDSGFIYQRETEAYEVNDYETIFKLMQHDYEEQPTKSSILISKPPPSAPAAGGKRRKAKRTRSKSRSRSSKRKLVRSRDITKSRR